MRAIKASEVVTGMTVRVEQRHSGPDGETVETIEGRVYGTANANIQFGNGVTKYLSYDHPVTVLAEPEPEWVEGAWYWTRYKDEGDDIAPTLRQRMADGWFIDGTPTKGGEIVALPDDTADFTVLGRVLIVDWPGDDAARELDAINDGNRSTSLSNYGRTTTQDTILGNVADAIRTQGGVR